MTGIQEVSLDNQTSLNLVNGLFQLLKSYVGRRDQASIPAVENLENYLDPKLQLTCNEEIICRNIQDFVHRIKEVQNYYEVIEFSDFLENPLAADNKIVLRYHLNCIRSTGENKQFQIISILTVNNGKISDWNEVLHEKGSCALMPFQKLSD